MMRPARFSPLSTRGLLAVAGEDCRGFLQGLVSNDIRRVAPDRAIWTALLTPQGKFLHEFFVIDWAGGLLLEGEADRLDDLARRLRVYKLRSKVTIATPEAPLAVWAAFDEGALERLGLAAAPGSARPFAGGVAFADPRLPALGARAVLPAADGAAALREAGLAEAPFEAWDAHRLALGVPDGSRDLELEKTVLLEAGFDELNGVDWQKGCYMGQELTARTKYRGLVKRRLLPVAVEGALPPPGTPIRRGDREVGEIRSGRDGRAMALLRLDALDGEPPTAAEATIVPQLPGWVRLPE